MFRSTGNNGASFNFPGRPVVELNDVAGSGCCLLDKQLMTVDNTVGSPFQDRVYVSWTRFLFNPSNGSYVQSPIFFAYSTDGGHTFSEPKNIAGNVLYDQGSRPIVGYDGSVYVIFQGAIRSATLDATYIVKSTDGGVTFGKPVKVAELQDVIPLANTAFRVNSSKPAALWENTSMRNHFNSCVSLNGFVYGIDGNASASDASLDRIGCRCSRHPVERQRAGVSVRKSSGRSRC